MTKRGKYRGAYGGGRAHLERYDLDEGMGEPSLRVHLVDVGLEEARNLLQLWGAEGTFTTAENEAVADLVVTPGIVWDLRE